jgi:hypothetical protein
MTPPTRRTTPLDGIATSKNAGKAFAQRIPSLATRTQPGIPDPQPWKPSRVQRHRRALSSCGQLLHVVSKQPHLNTAKAADPPSLLSPTAAPSSLETGRRRAGSRSWLAPRTASLPSHGPTPPPQRLRAASTKPAPSPVTPRAQAAWPPDSAGAHADAASPACYRADTASGRSPMSAAPLARRRADITPPARRRADEATPARPHVAGHQQRRSTLPPCRTRIGNIAIGSGRRRGGSVALTTPTPPAPASFLM